MFLSAAIDIGAVTLSNIQSVLDNSTMDEIADFIDVLQQADSAYAFSDPRRQYARSLLPFASDEYVRRQRLWDAAVQNHHVSYAQAKADPAIRAEFDPIAAARMLDPRYSAAQKATDIQTAQELYIANAPASSQPLYVAQHEAIVTAPAPSPVIAPAVSSPLPAPTIPQIPGNQVNPVFTPGFVADPNTGSASQTPPGAQTMLPPSDGGQGGGGAVKLALLAALAYLGM